MLDKTPLFSDSSRLMCGRYTLRKRPKIEAEWQTSFEPRFNIAPTQSAPILQRDGDKLVLRPAAWGHSLGTKSPLLINIRAETVRQKFRGQLESARCAVPADGFYEWKKLGSKRLPYHFTLPNDDTFWFAGLVFPGNPQEFAVLTTGANEIVAPLHDRMPVIFSTEKAMAWVAAPPPPEKLLEVLAPIPAGEMKIRPVNPGMNAPAMEGPKCLDAPPQVEVQGDLF